MKLNEVINEGVFIKVKVNNLNKKIVEIGDIIGIDKNGVTVKFDGYTRYFYEKHGLDRGLRYMSELKIC